jgi:hypothetical protein
MRVRVDLEKREDKERQEGRAYRNAKKGVSPRLGPPAFLRLAPEALNLHRNSKPQA